MTQTITTVMVVSMVMMVITMRMVWMVR
jgi:hypothetical protein